MAATTHAALPFLNLNYRQDLDILFCRWRSYIDLKEFTQGYSTALELARANQSHFWLQDLRLRNVSTGVQRNWFEQEFVPAAAPHPLYIAYLMSPLQHQNLVSETMPVSEVLQYGPYVQVRYFTNEHDALYWLQSCRERIPA